MGDRKLVPPHQVEYDGSGEREQWPAHAESEAGPIDVLGPDQGGHAGEESRPANAVRCPAFSHLELLPEAPVERSAAQGSEVNSNLLDPCVCDTPHNR